MQRIPAAIRPVPGRSATRLAITAVAAAVLCLPACRRAPQAPVSFYHWKQVLALDGSCRAMLAEAGVKRLFVRFFDVDLDPASARPVPVAELECRGGVPAGVRVVPVVFLAERVFRSACDPLRLAAQVAARIAALGTRCGFARPTEVQVDCDWTESSRGRFFAFLASLKQKLPAGAVLSATLRLHQVKFREREGVPPVARGTLMLYNMGDVESPAAGNSIIDAGVFRVYANGLGDYPLPFDLALPIYRWGLVYRLDRLARIVNDLGAGEVAAAGGAFQALGQDRYLCRRGAHLGGTAFFAGDLLRLEAAAYPVVSECLRLARRELKGRPVGLVFYHLDPGSLARFGRGRILDLARQD
jgi:hypothetical protein